MRNFFRFPIVVFMIALVWLLLVSIAYVYTHKAFSPEMLLAVIKNIWLLGLSALLMSLSGGLGRKIYKLLGVDQSLSAFTCLAIGLGIFSLLILFVGVFIGVKAWLFGLLAGALAAWLWREMIEFWRQVGQTWQRLQPEQLSEKLFAFIAGIILLANLSVAFAPPLAFDALVYHLTLPLRYLQTGQIIYISDIMFWGMPQLAEMHYLFMLALGGESAPAVLGWMLGFLTLLALGQYVGQKFDRPAAWFGIAALLSGFTFSRLLGLAYIEWFLLLYALTWWQVLERALLPGSEQRWIVLLAVVAGFALSLKYTAGVLVLLSLLALLLRGRGWKRNLADLLLFGLLVTAVSLPWWIKNLAWTGNPFYPLLFPAGAMDATRYDFYHNIPSSMTLLQALGLPWYASIWGVEGKLGPSASIGPLLLAFWPLAYFDWRAWTQEQRRLILLATLLLLVGFVLWGAASFQNGLLAQTRLFVVIFPLWAILSAAGFKSAMRIRLASVRLGQIALAIVLMFLVFNVFETLSEVLPKRAIEANFGLFNRDAYLERNLGDLYNASKTIQQLPPDSKVLMLWETRSFYCAPVCDPDEIIDRWYHEARLHSSAEEIQATWREQGYTHMLIWEQGFEFVRDFDNAKFNQRDWLLLADLRRALGPGQQTETYSLYPLTPDRMITP